MGEGRAEEGEGGTEVSKVGAGSEGGVRGGVGLFIGGRAFCGCKHKRAN